AQERAFLGALQEEEGDEAAWRAYSDWLMERGEPCPGARLLSLALPLVRNADGDDPAGRNLVQVGEHVAHVSVAGDGGWFDNLTLFAAPGPPPPPIRAHALTGCGSCGDILPTGKEPSCRAEERPSPPCPAATCSRSAPCRWPRSAPPASSPL